MRHTVLAACLAVAVSPAAHAFDTAECGVIQEQIMTVLDADLGIEVTQSATSTEQAGQDSCTVTDLDIYVEALGVRYRADTVTIVGPGLMDWVAGDAVLPPTFDARLEGLAVDTGFGVPQDLAWLVPLTAETITLSTIWTESAQRLQVSPLRIDLGADNVVVLALDGRAAGWTAYTTPAADFALTDLTLAMDFNGLFEQAFLPPLTQNGVDLSPASVTFVATLAEALMANLPPSLLSEGTPVAVRDFLLSLPAPRGRLELAVSDDMPFSLDRIVADMRTGIPLTTAVPPGLSVDAKWTPATR